MADRFQTIIKNTCDKIFRKYFLLLKFTFALAAVILCSGFFYSDTAEAASGFKIYDYSNKKASTYTGIIPKVILNGNEIEKEETPGILVDGIALLPYYDFFSKSDIAADCAYDKSKGTVTISKYGTDIVMKIDSREATVNGKSVTLPAAPMKLKYTASGLTRVLVPSRFVSETLGLGYTWYSSSSTIEIVKHTIQLSYNHADKFEYAGAQGKVTIDGKKLDLGSMPSVITNNTAMLRAKKVFADSAINAAYSFSKANNTITLSKGDNKLIMKIGDKTADLNGRKVKLDTAPMIVTNCETGASYIMVPGAFTAASLGYDYTWNKATKTSVITTRKQAPDSDNKDDTNSEPELGDSGAYNDPGTILNEWKGLDSLYGAASGIHEFAGSTESDGNIYYVSRDFNNVKNNCETFLIASTTPFGKISSSISGKLLDIMADNVSCSDQTYQMFGLTSNMVNTLGTYNYTEGTGTLIELDLLTGDYKYDISLSADRLLLITVYTNSLTSAAVGVNADGDYLTLAGLEPFKMDISEQSGLLSIDLPGMANGLGEITAAVTGAKFISQIYVTGSKDKTQIILSMEEGYEYYLIENGNQCTLSFRALKETEEEPEEEPEPQEVIDKSRYEIMIPKPSDVTQSMISEEDYYFDHYFVIRIKGDYSQFFNNNDIVCNAGVVDRISTAYKNGRTEIKIATSKLQGYAIASDSEAIYVHIGNPKDIYKNIVVLDPGHGGSANGAEYFGSLEKDLNLKVLYTLGRKYFNSDTSKLKVYYTRTTDVDLGLNERAAFVKTVGADLFVSLHMNAATATGVHGCEVFYSTGNNAANNAGLRSQDLAALLNTNLHEALGTTDRGVKADDFLVIHRNTVPAVLIELGFLSNKSDYALLTDEGFQENAAQTIYNTLLQIFETYPTGR